MNRRHMFGVDFDPLTTDQVIERCVAAVREDRPLTIGVVNAAKAVKMQTDERLRASVTGCDLVVADGQSVVWASKVLRQDLPERVAGIDLLTELLSASERIGMRCFFLGAKPEILERMLAEVSRRYPGLKIAGSRDGYFTDDQAGEIARQIRDSGTDLLFLGMSSPKKENFQAEWGPATGAKVIHGVGGSFDVLAGLVRRAPRIWQRLGMEWLYRLVQEPVRLGPRYLTTNSRFMLMVGRAYLRRGKDAAT